MRPATLGNSRREFLLSAGTVATAALAGVTEAFADRAEYIDLGFANGRRRLVTDFPQKGTMVLLRTRPPLLETPFETFDRDVFTPNSTFYVRWHLANIPTTIDPSEFRLMVHGHVRNPISLSLIDLVNGFPSVQIAAVNQCSGNSRGYFAPRVAGGEWGNGAMGNAIWRGVRLSDVLERAGVMAGALQIRFKGLDTGALPQTPLFMKSLALDHASDGEVMIAYEMNGQPLPLLNGFPIRLVVPGWYATYWVKMLSDIEVLDRADDNFWMSKAYLIPDTAGANMAPGQKGVAMVPINRMVPRSFITNPRNGATVQRDTPLQVRGIAFGGDTGVARVLLSIDGGGSWQETRLGANHGKYSFRQWRLTVRFTAPGSQVLMCQAVSSSGLAQPTHPNWNPSGFMRNVVESVPVVVV
jgi:DMSO/TMAO reductase YedYZ molybdopterin-dependent catalytic subunit